MFMVQGFIDLANDLASLVCLHVFQVFVEFLFPVLQLLA